MSLPQGHRHIYTCRTSGWTSAVSLNRKTKPETQENTECLTKTHEYSAGCDISSTRKNKNCGKRIHASALFCILLCKLETREKSGRSTEIPRVSAAAQEQKNFFSTYEKQVSGTRSDASVNRLPSSHLPNNNHTFLSFCCRLCRPSACRLKLYVFSPAPL